MSKHSKGIIWLADTNRHATLVTYHRGLSGADHKFVWVEKHQAHIYEGRELEEEEFNKVALEIFGSRDATYHKPVARLVELVGADGKESGIDVVAIEAKILEVATENADLKAERGTLPEGAHPDEAKPRGKSWLEERANWAAEVARQADYIKELEAKLAAGQQPGPAADILAEKDAEIARLQAEVSSLTSIISGKAESTPATAKKRPAASKKVE
jgi:hypothetical protein